MIDLRHATGHGVRVAVLDSGVHAQHPHVMWTLPGFSMTLAAGRPRRSDESLDVNGHGTACAGVIRWGARDAGIVPVRVLDALLQGHAAAIAEALRQLLLDPPGVINFSLGVAGEHAELDDALAALIARGSVGVAAMRADGSPSWPIGRPGVIGVGADAALTGWRFRVDRSGALPHVTASPYPRPIPGHPPQMNVTGTSFAAPRVSALVARALEVRGPASVEQYLEILDANASGFYGSGGRSAGTGGGRTAPGPIGSSRDRDTNANDEAGGNDTNESRAKGGDPS